MSTERRSFRKDIQFLRGLAVLAVLLYHAKLLPVEAGYLGVDVFFVLSGFLITSIILKGLDKGTFSFSGFYLRRAKRLLPAAYSTLLGTTLLGYLFLTPPQWDDYARQLAGMLTFTANIALPLQTGYFEAAAEGKPLLHTWSLSLEEQYYFVMPLLLLLLPKNWRGIALLTIAIVSAALCFYFVSYPFTYWRLPWFDSPTMAFYFLPLRAWELMAGSILAYLSLRGADRRFSPPSWIKLALVLIILYLMIQPLDGTHPRLDALLVVLATMFLIAGRDDWLPNNRLTRGMVKIGDWSYSLYLVHWPLFAFAFIAYLGEIPPWVRLLLLAFSFLLAYLQYEHVEQRFRYGWQVNPKKAFLSLGFITLALLLSPAPALLLEKQATPTERTILQAIHQHNRGLHDVCGKGGFFDQPERCTSGPDPIVAVWGDSYAMHLVPGLLNNPGLPGAMVQITKSSCAPIRGIAAIEPGFDAVWAKGCVAFNEKALDFILETPSIRFVILSSPFIAHFSHGPLELFYWDKQLTADRNLAIQQMKETLLLIKAAGKEPILISPPPMPGYDIGECLVRRASGLLVFGREGCDFSLSETHDYQGGVVEALNMLSRETDTPVLWLSKLTCNQNRCATMIDGIPIYRDGGHLTVEASKKIVSRLPLVELTAPADGPGAPTQITVSTNLEKPEEAMKNENTPSFSITEVTEPDANQKSH